MKFLALAALMAGWLVGVCSSALAADSAVVLTYHRFDDDRIAAVNTRLDQLDAHIAELQAGHRVMALPAIIDALKSGKPLPDRAVALTMDDGWRSVWAAAWPRLRAAGLPFTIFIATDEIDLGGPDRLTWAQLREMATSGLVTIGSQGAAHLHLAQLPKADVADDLARSRSRFMAELGRAPDLFAWPYGEMSRTAANQVRDAGFKVAFGQHSGPVWSRSDPWFLPRFAINEIYGEADRFRLAVRSLPLAAVDVTPTDPTLTTNRPAFGFTLLDDGSGADLACYISSQGRVAVERLGPRVEIRMPSPLPLGRSRINCTQPSLDGRWRWFGWQFLVER